MPHHLAQLITDFLKYLQFEKNKSSLTTKNYHFYLFRFINWANISEPSQITVEKVEGFRYYLSNLRNPNGELMKTTTQNYHLIALRAFLEYLKKQRIESLLAEKVQLSKIGKRHINFLGESDLEKLLEAPLQTKDSGIIQKRDKAILELLFSTGLKVSEVASLRKDQIDFLKDDFYIRSGGKLRPIPLSNQAKYWLKQYLDLRTDKVPALFIRHDKARKKQFETIPNRDYEFTPRTIQRIVKKYTKSSGLDKNITPHTIRHSYATHLLNQGFDLESVRSALGHSSITTTQVYKRLKSN